MTITLSFLRFLPSSWFKFINFLLESIMTTLFFSFSGFSCCSTGVWLRPGLAMYKELFDAFLMLSDACVALSFPTGSKVWFLLLGFDCSFSDYVVFSTICSCFNNWELLHSINSNLQLTQFLSSLTLSGFWFIISSNCEFNFSILLFSALILVWVVHFLQSVVLWNF